MILNLKNLNKYVKVKKFKMESLRSIIHALDGGLWACKIDLQDAYFHIAVRKSHRQYLRFAFRGTVYQFQTLAFGLTSAPRVFTKVVITLIAFLRQKGIHIHAFLDDWLIVNKDRRNLMQDVEYTLTTLKKLGFLVNHKKSMLSPSQIVEYLGATFHFNQGFVTITEDRWTKIQEHVTVFLKSSTVSAHQFLVLLGIMASCIDLAPLARLHMRPIQLYLLSKWRPGWHDLEKMILVEKILKYHLIWCTKRKNLFRGQSIQQQSSQMPHCGVGGGHLEDLQTGGQWSKALQKNHINWLELKAIQLSLLQFKDRLIGRTVLVKSDNSTAIAYIKNQGGLDLQTCVFFCGISSGGATNTR